MAGRILHIKRGESDSTRGETRFRIIAAGQRGAEAGAGGFEPGLRNVTGVKQYLRDLGVSERLIDHALADLAESGNTAVELPPPRVGPKIVRAWFDTIINPLIEAVETETALVESRDWSWRFRPGGLESIRPVRQYLGHRAGANLEQLSELYPEFETGVGQHDEAVAQFESAVGALYEALVRDGGFRALCYRLLSPESLARWGSPAPPSCLALTLPTTG